MVDFHKALAKRKHAFTEFQQMQEDRRPGFQALCDELAAKNPRLSRVQVEAEAKLEWHRRNPNKKTKES